MGAGTFTGIEAVSNGIPVLREPKVQTAKRTMSYMAFSLAFMVFGLIAAYLLFQIKPEAGKTLNAILFEQATASWSWGKWFVLIALFSEATCFLSPPKPVFWTAPAYWRIWLPTAGSLPDFPV